VSCAQTQDSQLPALETAVSPISLGHSTSRPLLLVVCSAVSDLDVYQNALTYLWGQDRLEVRQADGKDFTIIDLTHVNLRRLNPRKIEILLVREEYTLAYDVITKRGQVTRPVYLVTGQPGIGG
jgi:hypothetical protein